METRKLASIFVSFLNALISVCEEAVEMTEKELSKGGKDEKESSEQRKKNNEKGRSSSRSSKNDKSEKDDDDDDKSEKDDDDSEDDDGDDKKKDKGDDDEPSEDDIVDATRAALKVLDKSDVVKIVKKYGKAEKASEVEPELRQKVIDKLEEAVDAA